MWSLGVVTYVMLNKRLPFNGSGNQEAMIQRQLEKKVHFENKDTSPQYRVVVMALLEPDVIKRFNATAFLNSTWVRMDERLTVRSKHEKEAFSRAMGHREKILGNQSQSTPSTAPTTPSVSTSTSAPKRDSGGGSTSTTDPLAVIRQEQPSSYSSVLRDIGAVQEQDFNLTMRGLSKKKEAVTSKTGTRHAK
ncbi:hypothetical protein GE061_006530 [Apolygus lucorum]|uniref:Protein kinase domain-containing protein n=1 Tax=Apolygus lucorum TaxID=248454 RepID=A0A8S9WU91_APOLU|nr:hypothetical protein GE061_006530 [Apolygus lucorum]